MKMVPLQTVRSRVQFVKISSLGLIFCLSFVGGNISLRYLPVSFNQAIGATTPFFTAVFAYLMTLKREGWLTYLALVPVVTGVMIASGVCSLFLILMSFIFFSHSCLMVETLSSINVI
jgi:drug/metabolite transporter (DMT)-like permease